MKFSAIVACIAAAYFTPNKQPLMIWGPPGLGKSAACRAGSEQIKAVIKAKKFGFIDLRLALLEPIDLRGFPAVDVAKKTLHWIQSLLPTDPTSEGVIFLDELVQANPSMQAAASQLILDRRIGDYVLPEGWMIVAAGNRKSDKASVNSMPSHIANRFIHLTMELSVEEWIAWALKAGIDMRLVAFIKWRGADLLHNMDPARKTEAFPTPRSWEFVSGMLGANLPKELLPSVVRGAVGDAAGTEFIGFLSIFDKLPSIDAIFMNPATAPLVGDLATTWAVTTALVGKATKDNLNKIRVYMDRIKDGGRPEFAALALASLSLKHPELAKTRVYCEWASDMAPFIS